MVRTQQRQGLHFPRGSQGHTASYGSCDSLDSPSNSRVLASDVSMLQTLLRCEAVLSSTQSLPHETRGPGEVDTGTEEDVNVWLARL